MHESVGIAVDSCREKLTVDQPRFIIRAGFEVVAMIEEEVCVRIYIEPGDWDAYLIVSGEDGRDA